MKEGISILKKIEGTKKYSPVMDLSKVPKDKELKDFLFNKYGFGTFKIVGSKQGLKPGTVLPDVKIIILDEFSYKQGMNEQQQNNNPQQIIMSGNNDSKIYEILMNFNSDIIEKFVMIDHKLNQILEEIDTMEIAIEEEEIEDFEEEPKEEDLLGDMAKDIFKKTIMSKFNDSGTGE